MTETLPATDSPPPPPPIDEVSSRAALVRLLVAVADLAGRDWPDRARHAVVTLTAEASDAGHVSARVRLLADIRTAFAALAEPAGSEASRASALTAWRWRIAARRPDDRCGAWCRHSSQLLVLPRHKRLTGACKWLC